MKIEFYNAELKPMIEMLMGVKAKGRNSRAVSKFVKLISTKFETYAKDEQELLKEYCLVDDSGELVTTTKEGNTFVSWLPGKQPDAVIAQNELANEKNVIDLTEYEPHLKHLIVALDESDAFLSGVEAQLYDLLLDKLEDIEIEEEK
ncbi:hypothetical protein BFC20_10505 [Brochothrix thermosphacta]|uniref:DUF1617 family protein n=1 Tax=Brochothrix thermosphacta TaxID=2756 RepID=UPI000E74B08E|nr:DUF1617 family protein [Brochothrix thermosphacta]ANZ98104.1 hypothetical protein BFC20_10505 [Brochothrix thermosphacta]